MSKRKNTAENTEEEVFNPEDIFNPIQFKSISVTFKKVQNLTTRTCVAKPETVNILEFDAHSLLIEILENCGAKGHSIMIDLEYTVPHGAPGNNTVETHIFSATAQIISKEPCDDGSFRFGLQMVQYEEKSWQTFLDSFQGRQESINEFLKATRGY